MQSTLCALFQFCFVPFAGPLFATSVSFLHSFPPMKERSNRTPKDKRDEMVRLYLSGLSAMQVAARLGGSKTIVLDELKRRGIKARGRREMATGKPHALTPEQIAHICAAYPEPGVTTTSLGHECGVSRQTVANWLTQNGIPLKPTGAVIGTRRKGSPRKDRNFKLSPEQIAEMCQLHQSGVSRKDIAARFNIDVGTVSRYRKRLRAN